MAEVVTTQSSAAPRHRSVKLAAACLLTLAALSTATVSARQLPTSNFATGDEIKLQGCVVEGEESGSFVFSRVTAWPVAKEPLGAYGPRHFWLTDAGERLRSHLGKTVQVNGTITDILESEVERNPGLRSKQGRRVAIELPTGDVFTSPDLAGVSDDDRKSKVDMKITLVRVRIDSLLVVMQSCLPTMR
jgi:hypothetical protein